MNFNRMLKAKSSHNWNSSTRPQTTSHPFDKRRSDTAVADIQKNNRSSNNIVGIEQIIDSRRQGSQGHSSTNKIAHPFAFQDNRIKSAHAKAQSLANTRNQNKNIFSVTSHSLVSEANERPITQTATLYGIVQKQRTGHQPNLFLFNGVNAETNAYNPEVTHKRVVGTGGRSQRPSIKSFGTETYGRKEEDQPTTLSGARVPEMRASFLN